MYRCVFDHVGTGIALINRRMEVVAINNQMRKWYPGLDVLLKPLCYQTFNDPPRNSICTYCPAHRTFRDGLTHEALTETPSGERIRNFRIIASPIKNQQGETVAVIEMVEDATEYLLAKKQLEISENTYRTIFENTGNVSILIEKDTTIALVNGQFEKQLDYTKEEVEGRMSFVKLLPDDYLDLVLINHRLRRQDSNQAPRQYEVKVMTRTGELRDVLVAADMIPGTKRSVVSLLDITAQRQSEEAVRKQKDELEEKAFRLEEVNTALKVLLRQRAEDQNEIEARMVTNVKELVIPYLEVLKKKNQDDSLKSSIQTLETNLNGIMSPFLKKLTLQYANLTSREIQIANLVRDGNSTKEIADILNCSIRSVEFHRNNIRKALGLNKNKANLRSYLLSLS